VAGVLSGCGSGGHVSVDSGDPGRGQQLFTAKCASCHVLKAANAQGTIGPNLDATFRAAREQGLKESTFADVVAGQIRDPGQYPTGGEDELQANMPADLVKGQDLVDVSAFVAKYAGSDLAPPGRQASGGGTSGEAIFASNCASCHALAAAGASGKIGPNLDDLKPSLARTKEQVINGGGAMPAFKGQLTDKQIDAVSKFVADRAGK
jgi:cbb3-type cytochrome c oxidase subunit III